MTYGTEQEAFDKRDKVLKRMCILSSVVLILSLASLIVGITAIQTSDARFPYNAGGALVAGISALLLTICPMGMFYQARKSGTVEDGDLDCCSTTLALWTGMTILSVIWGFAVNGIFALVECIHPSDQAACAKNEDSKTILAVVTIILTSFLMILVLTIFFTCCCNAKTVLCIDTNRRTYNLQRDRIRDHERGVNHNRRIASSGQMSRFSNTSSSFSHINSRYNPDDYNARHTAETARPPPSYVSSTNGRSSQDVTARTGHGLTSPEHDPAGVSSIHEEPPPTYDEVMNGMPWMTREIFL